MTDQAQLNRTVPVYPSQAGIEGRHAYQWSGLVYVAAWLIGLALASSGPAPFDPAAEVHEYFIDHRSVALVQSLLVHGVAGVALIAFAVALSRHLAFEPLHLRGNLVVVSATAAAVVSFVQVGLMVALYSHVGGNGSAGGARSLFNAINKADTLKLVLLAVFVGTVSAASARMGALPRWIGWLGAVLVPLLVVGGLAFVFDVGALDVVLFNSLPLLLIWVAAASVTVLRWRPARAAT